MMENPDETEVTNNPYIMSTTIPLGKMSFIDSRQGYVHLAPPPKYFTDEFLMSTFGSLPYEKDVLLAGFEVPQDGGLICTD